MRFDARLRKLEAQRPAPVAQARPIFVPPMPDEAWWQEFDVLLQSEPYGAMVRDVIVSYQTKRP